MTGTPLLRTLEARFRAHRRRHDGLRWSAIQPRLEADAGKLRALERMEETGGEPDVIGRDASTGEYLFFDCAPESPLGRRSLCYDGDALASRKQNKPAGSAVDMALSMGVTLLTEEQYRALQHFGAFDTRTSSWIWTPARIRSLGGALFCDRRYETVFVYHNGAESYYAARGFRAALRV